MEKSSVWVIILNWNNAADTLACLNSVFRSDYPNFHVLVVDNGSTDGSPEAVRAAYPTVTLIENGANLGYAEGNNVGIRHALAHGADYVLLLNNDTTVDSSCLANLIHIAQENPNAAFLGPKIYHREDPLRIQSAGRCWISRQSLVHRGQDEIDRGQYDVLAEVDAISGCAMLANKQAIEHIGLLDPRFFMYCEDNDWCYRARSVGYKVLYVPTARAFHRRPNANEAQLPRITYYMTRNHLLFLHKNRAGLYALARVVLLEYFRTLISWTIRPRWKHKRRERDALLLGLLDFLRGCFGRAKHSL